MQTFTRKTFTIKTNDSCLTCWKQSFRS